MSKPAARKAHATAATNVTAISDEQARSELFAGATPVRSAARSSGGKPTAEPTTGSMLRPHLGGSGGGGATASVVEQPIGAEAVARRRPLLERAAQAQVAAGASLPARAGRDCAEPSAAVRTLSDSEGGEQQKGTAPELRLRTPIKPPAPRTAAAASGSTGTPETAVTAGGRGLESENEKLRAQLAVMREQAASAEEGRRQAQVAAEKAAAERDDFQEQAHELQLQLQEVHYTGEGAHGYDKGWGGGRAVDV